MPEPGLFIGARLSRPSVEQVSYYLSTLPFPPKTKFLPHGELHVTIIASKMLPLAIPYPLDTGYSIAKVYDIKYIGKALALILESKWLRWRYDFGRATGMRSSFGGYIPHMSLCYDPPKGLPIATWPKPDFNLELTGEYTESFDPK